MKDHEKLLGSLVEINSVSGHEVQIRSSIQSWFKERGVDSFVQDENLVVHFNGKDSSRAFIFNSHLDTVGPGNTTWKFPPWTPTWVEDRLYGLGTSDMKSGITTSMLLAKRISDTGQPSVDTWFTYVAKEETDGSGSQNLTNWLKREGYLGKYKEVAGIITEPTGLTEVEYGHRGSIYLEVTATGNSGHAATPWEIEGLTGYRKMVHFADNFQAAIEKWNREFPSRDFARSLSVGEMTTIRSNVVGEKIINDKGEEEIIIKPGSINKIPSSVIATFDLRMTPETQDLIFDRVCELGHESGVVVNLFCPIGPSGLTDPKDKIVQLAKTTLGSRHLVTTLTSADLGTFSTQGIKMAILGPGEGLQCHATNEYCHPIQIPEAVEVYQAILDSWAQV